MIINLTPHQIVLFNESTPDQLDDNDDLSRFIQLIYPKSLEHPPVRIVEINLGTTYSDHAPIEHIEYGRIRPEPSVVADTYYIVSLATALAAVNRSDFIVPFREVRNLNGTVIGCRSFAKPC